MVIQALVNPGRDGGAWFDGGEVECDFQSADNQYELEARGE